VFSIGDGESLAGVAVDDAGKLEVIDPDLRKRSRTIGVEAGVLYPIALA
jgi:hypothetical protein